jgi:hypothetical protein
MPPMLRATIWRDLRWRLLAASLLVVLPTALVAWSQVAHPHHAVPGGATYLDATWFWLPGGSAVFLVAAVLLAAGGSLLRPRRDVAYVLALPVSRRRWLLTHAAMSLAALAALVLFVHVLLTMGAVRAGAPLAHGPLLARSLAVLAAASAWIGVTVGVLALVRHPALAVALVLGVVAALPPGRFRLDLPPRAEPPLLPAWDPWAFADPRAWDAGVPVASLLAALAFGTAGMVLALHRVERFEP